ncbi:MarR family transcriptional regulator [Streptomyces griseoluteus]|uniref:MarR family transcriptional regulator n=1 Tax=Streptomyces griseoluteus TaxID=29306 RepID=A0A4Z1DEA5_STRGP|nr:MarR family transcriptional regulator [Streptomyces griseoluteus]TGN80174.1 MarR family transcriptional regulator [Streptomyces griseoluteus]GHE95036.1 MarR family transcriptional regulator [Streptomyces griseoluteus]
MQPERPEERPPSDLQGYAVLLRTLNSEINRIAHAFAQAHGLHATDVHALAAIMDASALDGEPMTPSRLRERLNLTSGAVSACLDRLERAGHVTRARDSADRRVVHLHYNPAARTLARQYFTPLARGTEAARRRFTPEQLETVAEFLGALNRELAAER